MKKDGAFQYYKQETTDLSVSGLVNTMYTRSLTLFIQIFNEDYQFHQYCLGLIDIEVTPLPARSNPTEPCAWQLAAPRLC